LIVKAYKEVFGRGTTVNGPTKIIANNSDYTPAYAYALAA